MKVYTVVSPSHKVYLEKYFLPTLPDEFEPVVVEIDQFCPSGTFYEKGWADSVVRKIHLWIQACEENFGETFVCSDCDIQFFGPVKDVLIKELGAHDMACQGRDVIKKKKDTFCSGFFICRANSTVLNLFKTMLANFDYSKGDQYVLNKYAHLVDIVYLSKRFWSHPYDNPRMWRPGRFELDIPRDILLHHATGTSGEECKLKLMELVKSKVV